MKGMRNMFKPHQCPYYNNSPAYSSDDMHHACKMYQCPYFINTPIYNPGFSEQYANHYHPYIEEEEIEAAIKLKDYGPKPFVVNIEEATKQNNNFRTALWTGDHLQLTLMSIAVGGEIGLEMHPDLDQFIRIEEGQGLVKMGDRKDRLDFQEKVYDDFAFIIPAGKWHNLINQGNKPIKLYSIYAPPQHPFGTVHETKAIADAAEEHHG
jgi:mannose-6-phosphate isomerase-like protein (cupin superfamily)